MERMKITLKGSCFFKTVVEQIHIHELKMFVCNKKKGIITCEYNNEFMNCLEECGVIVSKIPNPEKMTWHFYPAEFRITTETFRGRRHLHNLEKELGLPYDSLLAGHALSPEQREDIEIHGYELEILPPPKN